MVSWQDVCKPKDQGGLGVTNTKKMNVALMLKWVWRMLTEQDDKLMWLQLLKAKYGTRNFFASQAQGGSPFWRSLHRIKHLFGLGARFHLGDGVDIRF